MASLVHYHLPAFSFLGVTPNGAFYILSMCVLCREPSEHIWYFLDPMSRWLTLELLPVPCITDSAECKSLYMCLCKEPRNQAPRSRIVDKFKTCTCIFRYKFYSSLLLPQDSKGREKHFLLTLPTVCYHTKNCSQFYRYYVIVVLSCLYFKKE